MKMLMQVLLSCVNYCCMNSCIYNVTIMHHRLQPRRHRFFYNMFMFYIDLDELPLLTRRFGMMSRNRFNFFSFRDKEHLQLPMSEPDTSRTTRQHIEAYLQQQGITIGAGKIMLLTNMNVLGYNFNPVSFYYCFDEYGAPLCCVAEVSNTFREMKPYFMGKEHFNKGVFEQRTTKYFYVSPFIDHDADFHFKLPVPGRQLAIHIDDYKNGERFFISTLTGKRELLTRARLFWCSIRFPLVTMRVMMLILWNALLLWIKKVPWQRKEANQYLQKNVYKKHISR